MRLRPHRPGDLDACVAMWADPLVTRYIGGRPFTREEVWARLLRYAGHWEWLGFGFWVIEEIATGRFLGEIGLANFKRDMEPPLGDVPEAGWVLVSSAQGNGFATRALRLVTAWHDQIEALGNKSIVASANSNLYCPFHFPPFLLKTTVSLPLTWMNWLRTFAGRPLCILKEKISPCLGIAANPIILATMRTVSRRKPTRGNAQ